MAAETFEIEVCGVCGIPMPQKLWSGARIVAGGFCAHRETRTLLLLRATPDELAETIGKAVEEIVALGDDDGPEPWEHYMELGQHVVNVLAPEENSGAPNQTSASGRGAMTKAILQIPGVPTSFNEVGLRSHWSVGRTQKLKWEEWISYALMAQRVPKGLQKVNATATIAFQYRRKRDEGNFRPLIEKALGDVLQSGGWLPDDDPRYYSFGAVELIAPVSDPSTVIVLDYVR